MQYITYIDTISDFELPVVVLKTKLWQTATHKIIDYRETYSSYYVLIIGSLWVASKSVYLLVLGRRDLSQRWTLILQCAFFEPLCSLHSVTPLLHIYIWTQMKMIHTCVNHVKVLCNKYVLLWVFFTSQVIMYKWPTDLLLFS